MTGVTGLVEKTKKVNKQTKKKKKKRGGGKKMGEERAPTSPTGFLLH
jgi:hypothetical protein